MVIARIGVVGAGQMGSGIAQAVATAGYSCVVTDIRNDALTAGEKSVIRSLDKLEAKKIIKDKQQVLDKIKWHADMDRLSQCDLVIEAVVENESVKKEVLRGLESILKEEAIIASNTSSIPITRLAHATSRMDKFIGMHFMNPVPLMGLVEIIKGYYTSDETTEAVKSVIEKMNKKSTTSKDYPGFIANRILMPMINEAFYSLMNGVASAEDIDLTMKLGCNFPMGPLALADLIGLDTCLSIIEVMHQGFGEDKYRPCPLLKKYVEANLLGRKSGQGVYIYQDN